MKNALYALLLAASLGCSGCRHQEPQAATAATAASVVSHVDPAGAEQLIAGGKVVILDLRTPGEYAAGRLAGARNLDFRSADFEPQLAKLDRKPAYLIHCASGRRSTSALALFQRLGFQSVIHLDGGLGAWERAGKPVQR
jgi:rhodanese-related sulfurtransferase